jgi:AcrR family transcriptional regulator
MSGVKSGRSYSSPVRDEQAARTKARILDAAADLFLDHGYGTTTIKAIADRADVARDTVHAVFGSKARVLTALIDQRLVPDGSVANVRQRPDSQAIKDEPDQHRQIALLATFLAALSTELRPVYEVLRTAGAVEPEMRAVLAEMDGYRMKNMQAYAKWIAARGRLRMSTKRAGETLWALASPDVARLLCDQLGWSESQHAHWLADSLTRTLLPDDSRRPRP